MYQHRPKQAAHEAVIFGDDDAVGEFFHVVRAFVAACGSREHAGRPLLSG
jgi:hypothetical protein